MGNSPRLAAMVLERTFLAQLCWAGKLYAEE